LGTGCAGFNAMQASVSQLDEAAHTADDAEVALLTAYRTSECRNANLDRVFASIERHSPDLRLSVACTYVAVSDADLKIRATLLATIALYADKLQALAGDGSTGTLTTNSESVAKSINSFGTSSGLSRLQITSGTDAKVAKGVEAAVIELTGFVLETRAAVPRNRRRPAEGREHGDRPGAAEQPQWHQGNPPTGPRQGEARQVAVAVLRHRRRTRAAVGLRRDLEQCGRAAW
jgi:hypothetical protein